MASTVCRNILATASRLPKIAIRQSSVVVRTPNSLVSAVPSGSRGFQVLTSFKGTDRFPRGSVAPQRLAHSEVEEEISRFLDKEIKFEESSKPAGKLPQIKGFEVQADGANVTLTKTQDGEKIVVKLNVNGSVDSDTPELEEGSESKGEPMQMVSRPPFSVEVHKTDGQVLAFHCTFPPGDEVTEAMNQDDADTFVDHFDIEEVAIYSGEWKENVYTLMADTMDGTLYDLMMDLLDERGIGDEFVQQLMEFSTAYEHGKYVDFLKGLKSFLAK